MTIIVLVGGLMMMIIGAVKFILDRSLGYSSGGPLMLMAAGAALSLGPAVLPGLTRFTAETIGGTVPTADPDGSPTPTLEPTATPTTTPAPATEVVFDATIPLIVGAAAGGLILLVFLVMKMGPGMIASADSAKRRKIEAEASRLADARMWARWRDKLKALNTRFLAYEKDLELIAQYPLMRDMSCPEVADAYRALTAAELLDTEEVPAYDTSRMELDSLGFPVAVRKAVQALNTAERLARDTGSKRFNGSDQADLSLAIKLIAKARDLRGASVPERTRALQQAVRIIERVVGPVPKAAITEIEAAAEVKMISA